MICRIGSWIERLKIPTLAEIVSQSAVKNDRYSQSKILDQTLDQGSLLDPINGMALENIQRLYDYDIKDRCL